MARARTSLDRDVSRSMKSVHDFLNPLDAHIIVARLSLQRETNITGHLCEIGVHHRSAVPNACPSPLCPRQEGEEPYHRNRQQAAATADGSRSGDKVGIARAHPWQNGVEGHPGQNQGR